MSLKYEELDHRNTPLGPLTLRRRRMFQFGDLDIYEIILDDEFLMSSLFYDAEVQLAKISLGLIEGENLDVVVGGLGLGYTAVSALEDKRIDSLTVIEALDAVIEWHQNKILPLGRILSEDKRCQIVQGDFFSLSKNTLQSFKPDHPNTKHDAILLDIDHTPTHVLHQTNQRFYTKQGLEECATHLKPGGVFGLWADRESDPSFTEHLNTVFDQAQSHLIEFDNPLTQKKSCGTVYTAIARP